ncbi:hypothetical protein VFPBJ_05987 [Purpureocillium lilacinum]|uniref:Uncharacterized protein n=1 Tax=Purpureocillium lilacinum TaxID=33203 RepID=A0A179GRL4_PURLI|nr:hypothetical protein VFPBJ_05987 [Purpureocillium lilacinum]
MKRGRHGCEAACGRARVCRLWWDAPKSGSLLVSSWACCAVGSVGVAGGKWRVRCQAVSQGVYTWHRTNRAMLGKPECCGTGPWVACCCAVANAP